MSSEIESSEIFQNSRIIFADLDPRDSRDSSHPRSIMPLFIRSLFCAQFPGFVYSGFEAPNLVSGSNSAASVNHHQPWQP